MIGMASLDVFATLFHPAGRGAMSDSVERSVWTVFRKAANWHPPLLRLAGPVIFLTVISTWVMLYLFGFALIYDTVIASAFIYAPGLELAKHQSFYDAFNVSLGSLITVGGDILPKSKFIRLLMGIEAVIGFGLLTASLSALLSIYPVLEQRRSLAHKATLLHTAERTSGVAIFDMPASELHLQIGELTVEVIVLRNSMSQFPVSYYFLSGEKKSSLPGILEYVRGIAKRAAARPEPEVRLAGAMLGGALKDYLMLLAEEFLRMPGENLDAVMRAYAHDHMQYLVPYGS